MIDYKETVIENKTYYVGIGPIINCETKVIFKKAGTNDAVMFRIEDDKYFMNTGLSNEELDSIKRWIDKNRLDIWKEAQSTALPTQEQITELAKAAADSLQKTFKQLPADAREDLINMVSEEAKRREL